MSLLKYNDYLTEKVLYNLLLESKMVYSKKFIGFLTKMKSNNIAKTLLDLYSKDINIQHNYIDVGAEKDTVSFTPDRKVQELEKDKVDTYEVVDSGRYLTNSSSNDRIFNLLGYQKREDTWDPESGVIGIIFKEAISPVSGKIYVWFKGIDEWDGRETVLNKEALDKSGEGSTHKIWSTSRNNIKIGRLVRSILSTAKISFVDKDIEEFVNMYKATYDVMSNALIRFDIVEGDKIAYWYNSRRYANEEAGVLGNSCMANVDSEYFDIYTHNPEVCKLVILYDESGNIESPAAESGQLEIFPKAISPKYKSDKIIGRALLWTTKDGKRIMDRIYTTKDNDVELFKEFGKKNGFWWKRSQDSDNDFNMENGESTINGPSIEIQLKHTDFDYYPYLDTFYYLDMDKEILSNYGDYGGSMRMLRDTGGGYDN